MRTRTIWIGVILVLGAGGVADVSSPVPGAVGGSISLSSTARPSGPGDPAPCEPGTEVTVCPAGAGRVECPPFLVEEPARRARRC